MLSTVSDHAFSKLVAACLTLCSALAGRALGEEGAPQQPVTRKMPDRITHACLGRNGLCLVMRFAKLKKIGVFDIKEARYQGFISVQDQSSLFAAGGNDLLLYEPALETFSVWDLTSLKRTRQKTIRSADKVEHIVMGAASGKHALMSLGVAGVSRRGAKDSRRFVLFDVENMSAKRLASPGGSLTDITTQIHMATDAHLGVASICRSSSFPVDLALGAIQGTRISYRFFSRCGDYVYAVMPFGPYICDPKGIFDMKKQPVPSMRGPVIPVYGKEPHYVYWESAAGYYRRFNPSDRTRRTGTAVHIRKIGTPDDLNVTIISGAGPGHHLERRATWRFQRAWPVADLDKLAILRETSIEVYKLGINEKLTEADGICRPGRLWTRKLDYTEGTKIVIEDGPEGMAYKVSTGELEWSVPSHQPPSTLEIIISVTEPGKKEKYLTLNIPILHK